MMDPMSRFFFGVTLVSIAFGIVFGWYKLMQWIGRQGG